VRKYSEDEGKELANTLKKDIGISPIPEDEDAN